MLLSELRKLSFRDCSSIQDDAPGCRHLAPNTRPIASCCRRADDVTAASREGGGDDGSGTVSCVGSCSHVAAAGLGFGRHWSAASHAAAERYLRETGHSGWQDARQGDGRTERRQDQTDGAEQ